VGRGEFSDGKNFKYTEIIPVVSHFNSYESWQQFSAMGEGGSVFIHVTTFSL